MTVSIVYDYSNIATELNKIEAARSTKTLPLNEIPVFIDSLSFMGCKVWTGPFTVSADGMIPLISWTAGDCC